MKSLFVKLSSILVLILLFQSKAWGGSLNYEVFAITTYAPMLEAPCYNNYSYLSTCNNSSPTGVGVSQGTGTLSSLNYNWNSGQINFGGNTNYGSEQRMVVITGYWQHPGTTGQTSTVHFAGRNDDGLIVNINNTSVVSDWAQQGPTYWNSSGSFSGVGGQWYPIQINWYEWGGSANMDLHYRIDGNNALNTTSGWLDMNNSHFSTSVSVNITPTSGQTTIINTAKSATGNGVKLNVDGDNNTINIEQTGEDNFIIGTDWSSDATVTGNNNTLNIDQGNVTSSGNSGNNGIALDITGSTNTLNISQGDYSTDTGDHRMWIDVDGSTNTLTLQQRNDGTTSSEHFMSLDLDSSSNVITMQQLNDGDKFLFLDVDNGNNTVDVNQSGTGEHYLDISLDTGSYAHDVDISQTGSGDHAARVQLDGYSTDFDLLQQGSTDQDYFIDMTCGAQAGCTLSTSQGN